ncbi:MAG: hypothetical protein JXL80_01360 [Planctomycetes bacterium]|nr:hypothetical protein [Planctomycetota bacterium]
MAPIKVTCPKCSKPFGVLPRQMGTSVHCPHCGQRMTVGERKASAPRSPQEEAAAQMQGPAPQVPAGHAPASSGGEASPAAAALEAAFGPPPAPKPAPRPVMAAPAPQPYQTRLAKNLGLDDEVQEDHLLDSAPIHSRTVIWVWMSILGVLVIGLVIGIVYSYGKFRTAEQEGSFESQTILGDKRYTDGPRQQIIVKTVDEHGNVISKEELKEVDLSEKDRVHPDELLDSGASALIPHWMSNNNPAYSVTKDNQQYDVWVGWVENSGAETVRRATWSVRFIDAADEAAGKVYGEQNYWFNDVKPGEKVYFIFETLYASGPKVGLQTLPQVPELSDTTMPPFEFDVKPLTLDRQGKTKGTIHFDVTNLSSVTAPVVDVLFILYSRDKQPIAWAKTQMMNLVPHRPERGQASWTDGHSFFAVDHVGYCRAQVVETGAAK